MNVIYKNYKRLKNLKFKNLLLFLFLLLLIYQIVVFGKVSLSSALTTPTPHMVVSQDTTAIRNSKEGNKKYNSTYLKIPSEVEFRMKWIENKIKRLTKHSDKWKLETALNDIPPFINTSKQIQIFYSTAYRNIELDGYWSQWKQDLPDNYVDDLEDGDKQSISTFISSNFYPLLGCYSSNDPQIIDTHFKQMQSVGIGVIIISWSPAEYVNRKEDSIATLLNKALKYNILIALKIEDYKERTTESLYRNLEFLKQYTSHPSYYKHAHNGVYLPVFYIHDSHLIPAVEWYELLSDKGSHSVRSSKYDGVFLGLILDSTHRYHIERSHFDGFYTYYASNGIFYGSSWKNWKTLGKFAREHKLLFLPTVSPGYTDKRVRPWNNALTRHRSRGHYYQAAWRAAISADTFGVTISSFNHWLDGTQIEPAVAKATSRFSYLDYQPEGPLLYLNLTKYWVNMFLNKGYV